MRMVLLGLALASLMAGAVEASANPVVPNGQPGDLRHGTYPSIGVGDGDWTHVGVDLVAPCGSRIYAFADGKIVDFVDERDDPDFDSLGYMVLVEHPSSLLGKSFYTLSLHLQGPPEVSTGDQVKGGETVLGRVGASGMASACHTHFEVRYFPERFYPEWGNIFGRGDNRNSNTVATNWEDPLPLFDQYPVGLSSQRVAQTPPADAPESIAELQVEEPVEQSERSGESLIPSTSALADQTERTISIFALDGISWTANFFTDSPFYDFADRDLDKPYLEPAFSGAWGDFARIQTIPWNGDISDTEETLAEIKETLPILAGNAKTRSRNFVVVGHSWGALLAYRAIKELSAEGMIEAGDIDQLVTLGSPLTSQVLFIKGKIEKYGDWKGVKPITDAVREWRNYVIEEDLIATVIVDLNASDNGENIILPLHTGVIPNKLYAHRQYYEKKVFLNKIGLDIRNSTQNNVEPVAQGTTATAIAPDPELEPKSAPIRDSAIGLWGPSGAQSGCEGDGRTVLVNSGGVILFERSGPETFIIFGPAEWIAGTLVLTRQAGDIILPPLDDLTRCDRLPAQYYAFFGEAIALFQSFDEVQSRCEGGSPDRCVRAIFELLDVSGDDRLSRAEIGRALRAGAFFFGYEAIVAGRKESAPNADLWQTYRVPVDEIYGVSVVASLLGPFFTHNLVQSYDFDADGVLSLSEILQDRGPDSLVAAGGAVGSAAAQTALQALMAVLQSLLGIVPFLR